MSSNSNSSNSYIIQHEKLTLRLKLADLDSLLLHEETIPTFLERLVSEIERDGVVRHPVIADEKSLIVLDGMHRVAALKKLNCRWIPVCLVDYDNPSIKVGAWYRTITGVGSIQEKLEELKNFGFKLEKGEIELDEIGRSNIVSAIKTVECFYLVYHQFRNLKEAYDYIKFIEGELRKAGFKIGYETEDDAVRKIMEGRVNSVMFTPKLSKKEIIETVLSGHIFSHKATRHVIPARPLYVNAPLKLLSTQTLTEREINEKFSEMLAEKKVKMVLAGSLIENRRYEEDVYIFE